MKKLFLAMAAMLVFCQAAQAADKMYSGFSAPVGMVYDREGNLYVAEWGAGKVTRVSPAGARQTLVDGLSSPAGLAFDDDGVLYIAGYGDGNIYAFTKEAGLRRIASGLAQPTGLLWNAAGKSLLVANRNAGEVVEIFSDGRRKIVSRGHRTPVGLARTGDGTLFVSCYGGSVDIIGPDGRAKPSYSGLGTPGVGIIAAGPDSVLVVDYGRGGVAHVNSAGQAEHVATGFNSPVGLARMPSGDALAGCWGDGNLYRIHIEK